MVFRMNKNSVISEKLTNGINVIKRLAVNCSSLVIRPCSRSTISFGNYIQEAYPIPYIKVSKIDIIGKCKSSLYAHKSAGIRNTIGKKKGKYQNKIYYTRLHFVENILHGAIIVNLIGKINEL